jgi:hypothetical protein
MDCVCRQGTVGLSNRPTRRLEADGAADFMAPDRIVCLIAGRGQIAMHRTKYRTAPLCSRGHQEEDCPRGLK